MTVGELINLIAGLALEAHEAALPTSTARRDEIRAGLAQLLEPPVVEGCPAAEGADPWNWMDTMTPSPGGLPQITIGK